LSQRHPLKEIIVVDDGSRDSSVETLEQYSDLIRLVKFSQNRGVIEARNKGATLARGDYLVFLDGDDLFMPWALDLYERIVAERNPKLIFGRMSHFRGAIPGVKDDAVQGEIEFVGYRNLMAKDRPIDLSASSFVVDRQIFLEAGGWSPGIFHLDLVDISTKLGYSGHAVIICSPPTVFYRVHAGNSIHTVPPFLRMGHRLMDKERAGEYPGGREHRFERYARLGGVVFFWTKRALRAGLYKDALRLAVSGRSMILAAIVCRSLAWIKGRRPVETVAFRRG
jgi:glycosyltransferase involved in cell wall biosynthesis